MSEISEDKAGKSVKKANVASPGQQSDDSIVLNKGAEMVEINGLQVAKIKYKGLPVITLRMMDEMHQRFEGAARQTFNRNKRVLSARLHK
ncbi:KilA-N, DNA-binding domain protein [Candidatus Magnetomorum sp. HK-1]|nr:KilA-N, DNA-binding domain protein [Candidatus Magnetomorum sp. HK-1]